MWPKETDLMSKDTHRMKANIWEKIFFPQNYKKYKYRETSVNKKSMCQYKNQSRNFKISLRKLKMETQIYKTHGMQKKAILRGQSIAVQAYIKKQEKSQVT